MQRSYQRHEEDKGADVGGDRISWQAQNAHVAQCAMNKRFAWTHGDAPEIHREALGLQRILHEVVVADRGAAQRDDDIGVGSVIEGDFAVGGQAGRAELDEVAPEIVRARDQGEGRRAGTAAAEVRLAARTQSRAEGIAKAIPCAVVDWGNRHASPVDVVVNCTPVGMHPMVDESPLESSFIKPPMVVMDTIYNPESTLLVRSAREKVAVAVTGLDMFIAQAAAQSFPPRMMDDTASSSLPSPLAST